MTIDYREGLPDREEFSALFATTGWNHEYQARPEQLLQALQASQYCICAYEGEQLVGFGRVMTDGVLHAMIYDMIVHPDYQRRGIGTVILNRLVEWCNLAGIRDIQLFSARGKSAFYGKNGFNPRPPDSPGMSYVRQKNEVKTSRKVYARRR